MQWLMMMINQQQGTGLIDANGKLTIDTDAYRTALTWIKKVADEGLGARSKFAQHGDDRSGRRRHNLPGAVGDLVQLPDPKRLQGERRALASRTVARLGRRRRPVRCDRRNSFVIPAKAANPQLAWLFYEHAIYSSAGYTGVFGSNSVYPNGLNTALPSVKSALSAPTPLFKPLAGLGNESLWEVGTAASLAIPAGYRIPSWFDQAANYLGANPAEAHGRQDERGRRSEEFGRRHPKEPRGPVGLTGGDRNLAYLGPTSGGAV